MKRNFEILFAVVLLFSFFLPWIEFAEDIPTRGIFIFFLCWWIGLIGLTGIGIIVVGPFLYILFLCTGIVLLIVVILCIRVLFGKSSNKKFRRLIFLLTFGTYSFYLLTGMVTEMNSGASFIYSFLHPHGIAGVSYGVYVALLAATGLMSLNRGE